MCGARLCMTVYFTHFLASIIPVYNCEGSWTDKNATFIVAKHLGSHHSVCISYQPIDGSNVRLFVGDTCYRSIPIQTSDHHLAANLTVVGKHSTRTLRLFDHPLAFSTHFNE